MNSETSAERRRSRLGGVDAIRELDGRPVFAPPSEAALAAALRAAAREGWRVAVMGFGSWSVPDPSADALISTERLSGIPYFDAADLVATVESGMQWDDMQARMGKEGTWVALDPPGAGRSVGSIVATATAGPLQAAFGGVADQLLGLSIVTGDGRVVSPGGRVVKNVAGFDLTRLLSGSWSAFGVITSVTFRLRAIPQAEITVLARGDRRELLDAAARVTEARLTPQALELRTAVGGREGTLAVRLRDTPAATKALYDTIATHLPPHERLDGAEATSYWRELTDETDAPMIFRLGLLTTQLEETMSWLDTTLGGGRVSANPLAGWLRWSGSTEVEALAALRVEASERSLPLTLERAPYEVLERVGTVGSLGDRTPELLAGLRTTMDPHGVFAAPIGLA